VKKIRPELSLHVKYIKVYFHKFSDFLERAETSLRVPKEARASALWSRALKSVLRFQIGPARSKSILIWNSSVYGNPLEWRSCPMGRRPACFTSRIIILAWMLPYVQWRLWNRICPAVGIRITINDVLARTRMFFLFICLLPRLFASCSALRTRRRFHSPPQSFTTTGDYWGGLILPTFYILLYTYIIS